ncbi:MAG: sulfatase-like hydrolase/transferase [Smithella sp.]|nr:sulfatase-like hydrolase/transferase [Smithella sp.]
MMLNNSIPDSSDFNISFNLPVQEWLGVFFYGGRMDMSMAGYLMILPVLGMLAGIFYQGTWYKWVIHIYTALMLLIFSMIAFADMELYRHWGFRMDASPLFYLSTPREALASASVVQIAVMFLAALVLAYGLFLIFKKYVAVDFLQQKIHTGHSISVLLMAFLLIVPIRGSFDLAPMNVGTVYFSKTDFSNHAAINVFWNISHSLLNLSHQNDAIRYMQPSQSRQLFDQLYPKSDSSEKVLKIPQPNVVVIVLESFTSKAMASCGGEKNITPNLDRLVKEGIFFTNFYANGDRSDKSMVCIFSGYPAQPRSSIVKYPGKMRHLPMLFSDFKRMGYQTGFYYGGDLNFANLNAYFMNAGMEKIVTKKDFPGKLDNSKWGVADGYVFARLFEDLNKENEPFFYALFSLSSHEPFEVPQPEVFKGFSKEQKFRNSLYYTDHCLGEFVEKAKKSKWWDKTLIVILADHGVPYLGNLANHDPDKFKIPMLWLGGALAKTGIRIDKIASQTDLATTLLLQTKQRTDAYKFGKDIFAKNSVSFAFYVFNNGFGFISDKTKIAFDNNNHTFLFGSPQAKEGNIGKAYLQELLEDYGRKK